MKKSLSRILAATMAMATLLLTGCGNTSAPAASASATSAASTSASTDIDWPKENITMVVPYSAGGDTDTYARQLAQGLSKELGTNVVVVNTTGGSGVVASSSVMTAKADGYTVLFHHTGVMLTQEAAESNEFSFFDDFEVVGTAARDDTYALIVRKDSPYQTTEDFIAYAKAHPGEVRFSVTYYGATHAVAAAMEREMGIEMNWIDVGSSTADRLTAFMADQCDVLAVNYMNIADYVENGDFTVLGICAEDRLEGLEDIPTLKEQGYNVIQPKIYEVRMPKGTDSAIVEKMSAAMETVVNSQDFADVLSTYYATPFYRNAADTIAQDQETVAELKEFFAE
jgi:tripartite-type tricarboxylate transporter receptor subunit TctC